MFYTFQNKIPFFCEVFHRNVNVNTFTETDTYTMYILISLFAWRRNLILTHTDNTVLYKITFQKTKAAHRHLCGNLY